MKIIKWNRAHGNTNKIIDQLWGNYNSEFRLKITTSKPSFCDYNDTYILAKGTISITDAEAENCASFTNCISEINIKLADKIPWYSDANVNLIEYSNNYLKTFRALWSCYRHDPNDNMADSESFKFKIKFKKFYQCFRY